MIINAISAINIFVAILEYAHQSRTINFKSWTMRSLIWKLIKIILTIGLKMKSKSYRTIWNKTS